LGRLGEAAAVDASPGLGVDQAELHRHPVQTGEKYPFFLAGLQAEAAVGLGKSGEPRVGQQRTVSEQLVENVRFLQVIQLLEGTDKGGNREAFAGQQFKERLEGDQRRYPDYLPAGGVTQHLVDLVQLRNSITRQGQLVDAVKIVLASAPFDQSQLALDQYLPDLMFGLGIGDETFLVRFAGLVLSAHEWPPPMGSNASNLAQMRRNVPEKTAARGEQVRSVCNAGLTPCGNWLARLR